MTIELTTSTLTTGLCFGEGPRWRDNQLWLSDMHAHVVLRVDAAGVAHRVIEVPNQPSGLGWLPNGDLLVVSMTDRRVLRFDGSSLSLHADLSDLASYHCNDMVVDSLGRAYVGNFGFNLQGGESPKGAEFILVTPQGESRVVADDLQFPNGCVITPDANTLIVAESFGGRLTAFDIHDNGDLSKQRIWAELPEGTVPDGICLDANGGIWLASPSTNECVRCLEGGEITHRVPLDRGAYACMLGGNQLYILSAKTSHPTKSQELRSGQIEVAQAPFLGTGWP